MNARQLEKIGIPASAAKTAIQAVQQLAKLPDIERRSIPRRLQQVAESLGFSSAANFATAFRRWTGVRPSEFRRGAR